MMVWGVFLPLMWMCAFFFVYLSGWAGLEFGFGKYLVLALECELWAFGY